MFCNQCGKQIPDDTAFCPECGAKVDGAAGQAATPVAPVQAAAPVTPAAPVQAAAPAKAAGAPAEKKKLPIVPIAVAAGVVVVLILLISLFSGKKSSSNMSAYTKNSVVCFDDGLFYTLQGKSYEEEEDVRDVYQNGDKTIAAYTVRDDRDLILYYIDSSLKPKMVAEDIYDFKISFTGEYIAYTQDVDDDGYAGTLYLYCVKNGKVTKVDSDVYPKYICMSPSGKAVSYLRDYEDYDENTLYIGGVGVKSKEVDDDGCKPVAITDNGKTLYYVNDGGKLYVYKGKEGEKLASDYSSIYFTKDLSEMLYTRDGKTYYYQPKMKESVKVCGNYLYGVEVPDTAYKYDNYCTIVGTDTFKEQVLSTDSGLYWFNKKGTDTVRITSSDSAYQISENGIVYLMAGDVYRIKKFSDKMEPELLYNDEYVEYIVASEDLSKIYITYDDELYYLKGKNKTEKITNDLLNNRSVAYNEAMKKVFFLEDDELYYADKNSKSKKSVTDEVDSVYEFLDGIMYTIDEGDWEYTYYFMNSSKPQEMFTE